MVSTRSRYGVPCAKISLRKQTMAASVSMSNLVFTGFSLQQKIIAIRCDGKAKSFSNHSSDLFDTFVVERNRDPAVREVRLDAYLPIVNSIDVCDNGFKILVTECELFRFICGHVRFRFFQRECFRIAMINPFLP